MRKLLRDGASDAVELVEQIFVPGGLETRPRAARHRHRGTNVAKRQLNVVGVGDPFEVTGEPGNRDSSSGGDKQENDGGSERQLDLFPRGHSSPNENFDLAAAYARPMITLSGS